MTEQAEKLRDDGPYENVFLNIGTKGDRSAYTKAGKRRHLDQTELTNLYTGDGFARRIIDLPAEEMTRAGYELEGVDDNHEVCASLELLNATRCLTDALRWSRLYGGAIIVLIVNDGNMLEDPLNMETVKELEALRVYDRWQITRKAWYDDPNDKRFGQTKVWQVTPVRGTPYDVHESRCLVFDGMPVPDLIREENDGWGDGVLQTCNEQLSRFNLSQYWGNQLLERAQQAVHGIPELTNLLRAKGGEDLIRKRIDIVDMTRSVNNTVVIDALETYDLKSTSFSGVPDILDRLGLALSSVTGMPESLLFGRQQGGLNSTGKSDLENWYAKVKQMQVNKLRDPLAKLLEIQLRAMGKPADDIEVEFEPLFLPSKKERSETDLNVAKTFEIYSNMNALDPLEVRKMLPDEGYKLDNVNQLPEQDTLTPEQKAAEEAALQAKKNGQKDNI